MLNAFQLAITQLRDRKIILLLGKVMLTTLGLLAILGIGLFFLLSSLFAHYLPADGGFAAAATAAILSILAAVFLFRVIAIFVINIFSDDVVDAVESKYYAARSEQAKPPSYALGLRMGLASVGRALGYNLLASPLYIGLLITGVGTAIAFFAVNAILIGRDLQDMVASRHVKNFRDIENGWQLPKVQRFTLGLVTTLLLAIPFVNFLAPIVGAAMATHLVHRQKEEEASQ
jgi:CysZ protein